MKQLISLAFALALLTVCTSPPYPWPAARPPAPAAVPPSPTTAARPTARPHLAGLPRINQIMWDLGATNLIITHPPGYAEEEYGYAASRGVADNLLTTDDLV